MGNAWPGPDAIAISDLHLDCEGVLYREKLKVAAPDGFEDVVLDLYKQIPPTRITYVQTWMLRLASAKHSIICGAPCDERHPRGRD